MGLFDWLRPRTAPGKVLPIPPREARPAISDIEFARLEAAMEPYKRMCLLPQTEDGEGDGRIVSKFGGAAWVGNTEEWPCCGDCKGAMQLLVQILTSELRAEERAVTGGGLIQLFCCLNENGCESGAYDGSPYSPWQVARVVPTARLASGRVMARPTAGDATFPSKRIVSWREAVDYPGWGGQLPEGMDKTEWDAFYARAAGKHGTWLPRDCDKVGGWPNWVQDEQETLCETCFKRMVPIVQIGSKDHLPWMWGDCGIGHVQVCPKHPERAAWGWECS